MNLDANVVINNLLQQVGQQAQEIAMLRVQLAAVEQTAAEALAKIPKEEEDKNDDTVQTS